MFSVNISEFAGSVISIRLDADLSTANDILTVTATDGSSTVTNAFTLPGNVANIAGANDTGFGMTAADLAGIDEDANLLQFKLFIQRNRLRYFGTRLTCRKPLC